LYTSETVLQNSEGLFILFIPDPLCYG